MGDFRLQGLVEAGFPAKRHEGDGADSHEEEPHGDVAVIASAGDSVRAGYKLLGVAARDYFTIDDDRFAAVVDNGGARSSRNRSISRSRTTR